MRLHYDAVRGLYVGELFTITTDAYYAVVDELVAGGMEEGAALALLLDEGEWRPDIEGVELIPGPHLCLQCRRPLWVTQTRFCDVVCEAAFYVEARL